MDRLHLFVVVLTGAVSYSHGQMSGSVLEVTVQPGGNITLYCDCKLSSGVFIVWYRKCSHENQPPLALKVGGVFKGPTANNDPLRIPPHFQFVRNLSSNSYDLLILNITDSDEGLYFCGTEEQRVEDNDYITVRTDHKYGNVTTRIVLSSSSCPDPTHHVSNPPYVLSWMIIVTPALTILSSFFSFILVYCFFQRADKEPQILQEGPHTRTQTRWNQEDDVCLSQVVYQAMDAK